MTEQVLDEGAGVENEKLDDTVRGDVEHIPFPIALDADLGGTFTLQIDLGPRGGPDDPYDRAGIDPGPGEAWWVDIAGGRESILSSLTADADPQEVARWIAKGAFHAKNPAAVTPTGMATRRHKQPHKEEPPQLGLSPHRRRPEPGSSAPQVFPSGASPQGPRLN